MDPKTLTMDLAGRELKITNHPISTYATGYAVVSLGDTVIMANACISEKGKPGADFFQMVVNYEEKMYAAGKIKGSRFVKRDGQPSENATLISRVIDRPLRPLFPKGTSNEVQIICTALSVDLEVDPATTALNAASVALLMGGAPFEGPIGAVRMGYVDDKLIVNPTYEQCENGKLNLIVAGTLDAITMVEAGAKEISEEIMLQALEMAHQEIKKICEFQIKYAEQFEITKIEADIVTPNADAMEGVKSFATKEMLDSVGGTTKKEVKKKIHEIEEQLFEKFAAEIEEGKFSQQELAEQLNTVLEKNMRKNILEKEKRIDGRKLTEVRPISIFLDVLPRTHGSAIFQRGETAALSITTLAGPSYQQIIDTMDRDYKKRYIHHYSFPPYATGEIKMLRGPNRREIGHGDLAERALLAMIPSEEEFGYTIQVVSEIIRCNGSSSMASVCGSTLSLMAAGVPIKRPVSGIAMGLVSDSETGEYKILSDIQGMEDFAGDMDFKVTGTTEGITALQMDIKIKGLSLDLLKNALSQAKEGRNFILSEMLKALPENRKELSKYAPMIETLQIDSEMIRMVIGKGGETIQKITGECNVEIDINDDGLVTITSLDRENGQKAMEWVKNIVKVPEVGEIYPNAKVVKIMEFGAFVEFLPGKQGLVHISKLARERVDRVEDVVKEGDTLAVKLEEIDGQGRYNLSHKATLGGNSESKPHPVNSQKQHKEGGGKIEDGRGGGHGTIVEGTSSVREV